MDSHVQELTTVAHSLFLSKAVFPSEQATLHQCRVQLDPFVFHALQALYGKQLAEHWRTEATIPATSDKAIVFVERRCHPNLEFCLQNAVYFAPGHAVHIVCSRANVRFLQHLSRHHPIHLHVAWDDIGTPEQGKKEYNELLKTAAFWNLFSEEHLLLMETDCYLRKSLPESLYNYDYVASKWPWSPEEAGGGGLSYRKRSFMLRVCALPDVYDQEMQDTFVSKGCRILGARVPTYEDSANFFIEAMISDTAVGVHQWWTFFSSHQRLEDRIRTCLTLDIC